MDAIDSAAAPVPVHTLDQRISPRAWVTWSAAVAVYFVAVFNRSSLGVAGPDAEHRFGINAASLSAFSMLQMLVYAAMQIPVGLLVDRFGPRRLLLAGLTVMCVAQASFAAVDSFGFALIARGLLGCGDAMVFISVLRIVSAWFPARRVALLTQLSALTGAAGGIASAWPLAWALQTLGWSGTFLTVAAVGACLLVLPAGIVRDTPHGRAMRGTRRVGRLRDQMRVTWARPQTRLGLWVHFTTGFPAAVFTLLWGYPFLVQGEGLGSGSASALLTLLICANMGFCFAFGVALTRRPDLRVPLALSVVGCTVLALAAVLLWPGRAPLWLLIVLISAYASNGAGSMIGFDVARSASPPEQLGTASGIVNVGAFLASAITLLATGLLVDATGAEHTASATAALDGFKIAFCFPFVLLALGSWQIARISRGIRSDNTVASLRSSVDYHPVGPTSPVASSVTIDG
ncbi:MFS transporter [Actinospica sp.]|jgi:MFS family permease|uniref:MFS transporter n=1 Tax=Actinospica sp. TaxID=1872142 RepID=UPI002C4D31C5|nr:MFS transporter [Actinospica sp.]HWG24805.1 MFS transporter [Actinospica sp.]